VSNRARDDRILPITRIVAALVIPFLVVAFVILYGFPADTERLFAWKLQPTMSAMMLAAAYAGGIYFFVAVLFGKRWHCVKVGLLPVTAFASSLGVATALHWDRFNHTHVAFFAWAGLYFSTPLIVLAVWLLNRNRDPLELEAGDTTIPVLARIAVGAAGVVTLLVAVVLMFQPQVLIALWPWKVTPLTARMMAALFALPGVVGIGVALDKRWSAARTILQSQWFGIALILLAVYRARHEFDWSGLAAWVFTGGLAFMALMIALLYFYIERMPPGEPDTNVSRRDPTTVS
jgi:hypothetical protein